MPKPLFNKRNGLILLGFGLLVALGILNLRSLPRSNHEIKPSYSQPAGQKDLADSFLRKASQNFFYREFPQAAENYYKAIAIYESRQDNFHIATTYELLGDLHIMAREFAEAEKIYIQAVGYYSQSGNHKGQASALKNIGDMRFKRGEYELAQTWYAQALAVNEENQPHIIHGQVQEAMGHLHWKTGNIPEAIKSFKQARETFAAIKYILGSEHLYHVLQRLNKISRRQSRDGAPPKPPRGEPY